MNKPVAIVLGGTYPHKYLINNLKLRGYYTILIDYYAFPPAKIDADEHLQESTLDKEKVLEIARSRKAELVISTCIDQANVTACYVAEKLKLPAPYSYEVALTVSNKRLMKEKMVANGIPTSKHINVTGINSSNVEGLRFPVIIKPADSNSSKGVRKASNFIEMEKYVKDALEISRDGSVIIEEFIEGIEISADCFIQNNKVTIFTTREKRKIVTDLENPIQQIQNAYCPADLTVENMDELKAIGEKIAKVFKINNTPLAIQAMLENGKIKVLEFAPRVGGGENNNVTKLFSGFDIIDGAVNSFLGIPVNLEHSQSDFYYSTVYVYAKPNIFGHVKGYEELLEDKTIEFFHLFKVPGMEIGIDLSSNNRIGSFLVKSKTKESLNEKIKKALGKLEVFDINGNAVMRKGIYNY